MGQHHGDRIGPQRRLHDPANGDTGRIHTALSHLFASQHLTLGIQTQQIHRFFLQCMKIRQQIFSAGLCCGKDLGVC